MPFDRPRQVLLDAVRARVAPCAVAEVGGHAGATWREAVGSLTYDPAPSEATLQTVFDLASLTKVIATTTLAMRMIDAGGLRLADEVGRYVPGWRGADRTSVTIADLLEHSAGLPAVVPLYEKHSGRAAIEQAICETPLAYPPRTQSVYSDPGFILLAFVIERVAGLPLDEQCERLVRELGLASGKEVLRFGPLAEAAQVAPTQFDEWRGRLLRGEVDDRNGAVLNGVAGHTGLFGTVGAVGRFAQGMLAGARGDAAAPGVPASLKTIRRFLAASTVPGSSRALGWDTMRPTSSCGTRMSAQAFGHTGFTGTSIWIDPRADVYVVLLTNRVHPVAAGSDGIQALRRSFHDAVMEEGGGRKGD